MKILFLADLNYRRPWVRERVPGLKKAIDQSEDTIILVDVYEYFGCHFLTDQKLFQRREYFNSGKNRISAQKHLLKKIKKEGYSHVLFSTLDHIITVFDSHFVDELEKENIVSGCIYGDDELNFSNYKFFLNDFKFITVYLDTSKIKYEELSSIKVFCQGNSYSLDNTKPINKTSKGIAFVGSPFKSRVELIRQLRDKGVSIDIYGPKKRWEQYPDLIKFYKGYLSEKTFFDDLNRYKFVYSSIIDMNGKIHMNTKFFEAIASGSYPIVEKHIAFENQFKLIGENQIQYCHTAEDIHRLIEKEYESLNLQSIQNHLSTNYSYDNTYKFLLNNFSEISQHAKNPVYKKSIYGAFTLIDNYNNKTYPWLKVPGHNIYKICTDGIIKIGFLKSLFLLFTTRIPRTNKSIRISGKIQNNFLFMNKLACKIYLKYKTS